MRNKLIYAVALGFGLAGAPLVATAASYVVLGSPGAKLDRAVTAAGGRVVKNLSAIDAVVAESDAANFKSRVRAQSGVQAVAPNLTVRWTPNVQRGSDAETLNPPNDLGPDTRFNLQWGHDAINAPEAWDSGYAGAGARVAVLDGGFQLDHPEFVGRFDPACTADMTGEGIAYAPNVDDPVGVFAHGMHTAGTIGAKRGNGGVIGVAYESTLCLIKVLYNHGSGSFGDVAEGIVFAANSNVDVINMSLGALLYKSGYPGEYTAREAIELINFINRAVAYAYQRGALVVVSSGNEGIDGDKDFNLVHTPSDSPHAMSVAATAPHGWGKNPTVFLDNPASYTNYGRSVLSVAAPGGDLAYTPLNESCTVAGVTRPCYVFDFVFSTGALNAFYWSAGTSMAAPHVSGVAALLVGKHGKMHPSQLRSLLERGADDLGQPGNDPYYGAGRVNAIRSLGLR